MTVPDARIAAAREPEPPMCASAHCEVRVVDEGDLCAACEIARDYAEDYERSLPVEEGAE